MVHRRAGEGQARRRGLAHPPAHLARLPNTTYRLTGVGKRKLEEYWQTLDEMRQAASRTPAPAQVRATVGRPRRSSEPGPA